MSVAIVSILLFEIGDFGFSDKAKNAFLYVSNHFSSWTFAKIRFLFYNATLYKNIISPKVKILSALQII